MIYTYSPGSVSITLGGLYALEGLYNGEFVTVTKEVVSADDLVALDGEVGRIMRKDNRYIINISLAQSSPSNNILTFLYNIDKELGIGKFPIYISEGTGTSGFLALEAWVVELPQLAYNTDVTERKWTLKCSSGTLNIGGNGDTLSVENALSSASSLLPLLKQYGLI